MNSDSELNAGARAGHGDPVLGTGTAPSDVHGDGTASPAVSSSQPAVAEVVRPVDRRVPPTSGWRRTFSSLADRDYLRLWLGTQFMMASMAMQMIAQGYLVYDITDGSGRILGLVSAGMAMPVLVLALFGGAIADRVERKRLIQSGQALLTVVALFVAVSIATDTVTWVHLLVASLLQGVLWSFMAPARYALVPQLVGQEKLGNAMALMAAGMSATTLVMPAVAGVLYAWIGPDGVYYVITTVSFLAVLFTTSIRKVVGRAGGARSAMMADIKAGLSYVLSNTIVLRLMLVGMVTILIAMPFQFLAPVLVVDVYHRETGALGLLVSAIGLGALLGSLAIATVGKWRRGQLLILGGLASGLALLLVALLPSYHAAVAVMVLLGLGEGSFFALNQTLIMEQVEDGFRGRVMSIFMMNWGLMPLGVLPAGLAVDLIGGRSTVGILAVTLLVVSLVVLVTQKRLRALQ